mgnify:CR=1 FL=1
MTTALPVAAGYVLGSMPWGTGSPRLFKHDDIRQHGQRQHRRNERLARLRLEARCSGRRARHRRRASRRAFVATLTVSASRRRPRRRAAMLGHWRPMFLRCAARRQGGGDLRRRVLGVALIVGGIGAAVWIVTFLLFRYASLASIVSALAVPVIAVLLGEPWPVIAFAAGSSDRRHRAAPRQHQPPARTARRTDSGSGG